MKRIYAENTINQHICNIEIRVAKCVISLNETQKPSVIFLFIIKSSHTCKIRNTFIWKNKLDFQPPCMINM